jgi:hypothetical protein
MARPIKEGLEYFPLDVDIHEDDKLQVVIGKFGTLGFGIVVRLMARIYKDGYFYPWTEREQHTFSNKINVDINVTLSVVSECIKWGFFHQKLYEDYAILTSAGFQKRFLLATSRRVMSQIKPEYNLVPDIVSVNINPVNAGNNVVSVVNMRTESTQSKVNKSKEKKKVKNIPSSRQKRTYAEDSPPYLMAQYFHSKIMVYAEESNVGHLVSKANIQSWADDCRKLLELDNIEKRLVRDVIDWTTSHSFWKTNILSPSKLREKFQELSIKMNEEKKNLSSGSTPGRGSRTGNQREKPKGVTPDSSGPTVLLSQEEHAAAMERAKRLDEKLNKPIARVGSG